MHEALVGQWHIGMAITAGKTMFRRQESRLRRQRQLLDLGSRSRNSRSRLLAALSERSQKASTKPSGDIGMGEGRLLQEYLKRGDSEASVALSKYICKATQSAFLLLVANSKRSPALVPKVAFRPVRFQHQTAPSTSPSEEGREQ